MITTLDILHQPFDVDFTFSLAGLVTEARILDHNHAPLPTPKWLEELLIEEIMQDEDLQREIAEANADPIGGER